MPVVREILSQDEFLVQEDALGTRGMVVGKTSAEILGACCRLVDLLDKPDDIPFLASLLQREIVYRVLRGPLGRHLRAIATLGQQSNRTAKAVAWLKANYQKPLHVEELASVAQMGVSTFHHHFRSLTAMSPLQYQKRLRLHMARVRMLSEAWMPPAPPSRWAMKVRANSIGSTAGFLASRRCGMSKRIGSPALLYPAIDYNPLVPRIRSLGNR